MRDESDEDAAVENSEEPREDADEQATGDGSGAERSGADGGNDSDVDDHDANGADDSDGTSDESVDESDPNLDAGEDGSLEDETDDTDVDADADSDSDSDSETDDTNADADTTDSDEDTNSDAEEVGSDSDSESDTDTDADADADAEDAKSDSDSDSSTDDAGSNDDGADEDGVDSSEDEADTETETDTEDGLTDEPTAKTDGEGYVHDQPSSDDDPDYPDPDDDGLGGISTPPDDQEMPLADHIEEMIMRFAVVLVMASIATVVGLLWASDAIEIIWADVIPESDERLPHIYHPLELWLTRIKVSALAGILVALPVFVYQCYKFMRPGLYPNERKYYLSAVPMSLVLALIGMFFSYILVLPVLFRYFTFYSEESAEIHYALGETFDLVITLTGFLAIVFQIPLFIMLAIMMGVTTRKWLADKRLYFWAAFFGLSFMFTMDPTLMAPIIVAIIMIVLFEGTLLLLKWTGRE